jgi:methionyl-tRNA synthetase
MKPKFYLTTPIYYVNAAPHIGHTYTTIAAETIKRFKRMQGYEVVLTTGTDEHGQKIERAAQAANRTPQEFTDIVAAEFRKQWEVLGLAIDRFQRTSSPKHAAVVQRLFTLCEQNGYVYKGSYTGQYCVFDELYVNDAKPGDPCPDCGRPTETVTEENYFFKLSAFQDRLLELYEKQPDFIQPETRRNEVLAFVKQGLADVSISRTTIQWGIPLPVAGNHVFYVWFDALITYMSAVDGEDRWPADLHLIGKEIVRFHAIYWPAFLMAAGLPLPKRVFAHGWLLFNNEKMSKSKGNLVRATPIANAVGVDPLRYFLLREIVFGSDGSFSYDALVTRYNADLANGLGNLASRTFSMIRQYRGGVIPAPAVADPELARPARDAIANAIQAFDKFEFSRGLEAIWGLISAADRYIVEKAPWNLAKKGEEGKADLDTVLYSAAEVLRIVTILIAPVLPDTASKLWLQLGMTGSVDDLTFDGLTWGGLLQGQLIGAPATLFPRLELKETVDKLWDLEAAEKAHQAELLGQPATPATVEHVPIAPLADPITIDDFGKVDLRVGLVKTADRVKGADKLLHLHVDIGEAEPRSIVAGIAAAYKPDQLVGRKVVIVANLQPRKLRGIPSQGMIVAASLEGGSPVLAGFLEDVPVGARLK